MRYTYVLDVGSLNLYHLEHLCLHSFRKKKHKSFTDIKTTSKSSPNFKTKKNKKNIANKTQLVPFIQYKVHTETTENEATKILNEIMVQ